MHEAGRAFARKLWVGAALLLGCSSPPPTFSGPSTIVPSTLSGSITSLGVVSAGDGAVLEVNSLGARESVFFDRSGAPTATPSPSLSFLGGGNGSFLATDGDDLLFLDKTGTTMRSVNLGASPRAATPTAGGATFIDPDTLQLYRIGANGNTVQLEDAQFSPTSLCPVDPTGALVATDGSIARVLSADGKWLEPAPVPIPLGVVGLPLEVLPHASVYVDCWSCGEGCWAMARFFGDVVRIEVAGTDLEATDTWFLPPGQIAASGTPDHAVVAALDVASSRIDVQLLTGRGDPTDQTFSIPLSDVELNDESLVPDFSRRIGVTVLDPNRIAVTHVARVHDGPGEVVTNFVDF